MDELKIKLAEKTGLSVLDEKTLNGETEIALGIPGKLPLFTVTCHKDRVGGLGILLTISQLN